MALYVNLVCRKERDELAKWELYMPKSRNAKFAERGLAQRTVALAKAEAQACEIFWAVVRGEVEP